MSECLYFLYFIFALRTFEIELNNRGLMVNHKTFNTENYSFSLGMILRYKYSRQSHRDLATLGLTETDKDSNIAVRSRQSR